MLQGYVRQDQHQFSARSIPARVRSPLALLHAILFFRLRGRLPLHVVGGVGPPSLERRDVIHDVTGTRPRASAGGGAGMLLLKLGLGGGASLYPAV